MTDASTSKIRVPWLVIIVCAVLVALFIALVTLGNSPRSGLEFSPDDFTLRSFNYREIWGVPIGSRVTSSYTRKFCQKLLADGHIQPTGSTNPAWHLVRDNVSNQNSSDFDAAILYEFLESRAVQEWTSNNPARAGAIWSAVADLARSYAYWAVPDLMEIVLSERELPAVVFTERLRSITGEALLLAASQDVKSNSWSEAHATLRRARKYSGSPEIARLLAEVTPHLEEKPPETR